MFVAGFIVGVIVAIIFSWFWLRQLKSMSSFSQVVDKEVDQADHKDSVINLEIEVENLQDQIHRVEELLSAGNTVFFPSGAANTKKQQVISSGREAAGEPEKDGMRFNRKKRKQGEVLGLWEKGRKPGEIARDTGLGQGEVELILSLRNKMEDKEKGVENA